MKYLNRLNKSLKSIGLIPPGTQFGDLLLPFLILTITIGVSWATVRAFRAQRASSIFIDVAGRQRMLSQRLYLELMGGISHMTEPPEALYFLDISARALRFGGKVENPRLADHWEYISKAPSIKIAAKLDEEIATIDSLTKILLEGFNTEESLALVYKISTIADDTVQLYVEESQLGVLKILVQDIIFIILLAGLGLGLNRLMVDRKYQLKELAKAKEIALQASEAKSMFLANMSHEIRTPLNAIIGMSELLQDGQLSVEQTRYVDTLRRASDTLLNLINDVLDLSRVESGQIDLDLSKFELAELVDQVSQIIALRAHQKGLELLCYISSDVPKTILADKNRLLQILMNLLSNAVKFTNTGEISLKIELEPPSASAPIDINEIQLKISVTDTGIGIAEEKLSAIFENFVQADSSVSFNYGGTGLGLAISKKLVALMGGHIEVKSKLGSGSTFTFNITTRAVERLNNNEITINENSKEYLQLLGRSILIVDDNDTNRFIVRKYLENLSCRIDEASSGEQALSLLRKAKVEHWHYDLILLDYRMPRMNGFEVARSIQQEQLGAGTIVSLLTSDGCQDELFKLPSLGIMDYLVKPIRRNDFLILVSKAFSRLPDMPINIKTQPAITATTHPIKKFRILVVDDVSDNRFVVISHLGKHHFEIDEATDGQQALSLVRSGHYDLIFMDMRMSPMDGYQATTAIRRWENSNQNQKRIPIVALTAHALKADIEKAKLTGCDYHLTKPITKARLFDLVENILDFNITQAGTPEALPPNRIESKQIIPDNKDSLSNLDDLQLIHVETESFLRPRLAQYIENRKAEIETLTEALSKKEYESIVTIGHNVSGTAGIYGMMGLSELARKVERAALESNDELIIAGLAEISSYLSRVRF